MPCFMTLPGTEPMCGTGRISFSVLIYYINMRYYVLLSAEHKLVFTPFWNSYENVDEVFILEFIEYSRFVRA